MKKKKDQDSINDVLDVIIAYARLDFTKQVEIHGDGGEYDALRAGVNMLGEELKASVVSLREKEVMLREIHHRVKNNLQIISSLLNLQIEKETDQRIRYNARESQNRIRAISLIHEMLYRSSDFKYTNLKKYVDCLANMLIGTYVLPGKQISIVNDIHEDVYFDVDQMIPIGLILNESICNSIKHAFGKGNGEITLNYFQKNGKHEIEVSDNGMGLKKNFDLERDGNLGIQLMHILAEQLGGRLETMNHKGVKYRLIF